MSSQSILFVYGFIGIWPDIKTVLPIIVTGEYGPIAEGRPFGNIRWIDYIPFFNILLLYLYLILHLFNIYNFNNEI